MVSAIAFHCAWLTFSERDAYPQQLCEVRRISGCVVMPKDKVNALQVMGAAASQAARLPLPKRDVACRLHLCKLLANN